jgi:hypothetical protein
MLVLNFEQYVALIERMTKQPVTLDYAGITKTQLDMSALNAMLKSQTCALGLVESGIPLHPTEYEWLEDLELITAEEPRYLTDRGTAILELWHFYFYETYEIDPRHIRSHWYAGNMETFYNSKFPVYRVATLLARNSKAAMDRFVHDLQSGVSYFNACKQLQHTPLDFHTSVCVPVVNSNGVGFVQEYLPSAIGVSCLKIAAAYHGVPLE